MTVAQLNNCKKKIQFAKTRADFIDQISDMDPGELVDVWTLLQDYSFAAVRSLSGLTQDDFSRRYGIPPTTVRAWTLTRTSTNRRNIQPYLLELLAVDVINTRAAKIKDEKMRKKKIYMVRVDNFRGKGGMVRNDKFFFGYGEAAEYEQEEKDKAKRPDNGDNIIIKSEEFEVEVPDGYEITTAGRLAFDMRITSQEPDWED